jgi:hypothetical protein
MHKLSACNIPSLHASQGLTECVRGDRADCVLIVCWLAVLHLQLPRGKHFELYWKQTHLKAGL